MKAARSGKPEHAVDLDTGAVVAAELAPGRRGRHDDAGETLAAAKAESRGGGRGTDGRRVTIHEDPAECVTDKGYHSRSVLTAR